MPPVANSSNTFTPSRSQSGDKIKAISDYCIEKSIKDEKNQDSSINCLSSKSFHRNNVFETRALCNSNIINNSFNNIGYCNVSGSSRPFHKDANQIYYFNERENVIFSLNEFQSFMSPFINLNSISKEIKVEECYVENIYSFEIQKKDRFLQKYRKRNNFIKHEAKSKTFVVDTIEEFKCKLKQLGN
jgi:hypothetical protein